MPLLEKSDYQKRQKSDRRISDMGPPDGIDERRRNTADRRSEKNLRYATFRIDKDYYALDVMRVQEVTLAHQVFDVPLSDKEITGLINLRGQVIPAFDMRLILGYTGFSPEAEPINIIIYHKEGLASILVDEESDYLELLPSYLKAPPQTLDDHIKRKVTGVCELPEMIIMVLDIDQCLTIDAEKIE